MKKWLVLVLLLPLVCSSVWAGGAHRIGLGANYWVAVDDIDIDDVDDDGLSYLVTYQWRPTLIGAQIDLEFLPDLFGEDAFAPAAYLVAGSAIYAAAGIGINCIDGDWADDPFIALKAGLDLELLPHLYLDLSACYRFNSKYDIEDALDEIDTDTVFLGAAARMAF